MRELLVGDARPVPALDLLVVRHVVPQLLQPRRHLPRVTRMHPVVPRREIKEDRRVAQPALRVGRSRKRLQWALSTLVTSMILMLGIGWWLRPTPAPTLLSYATTNGQQRQITLPDGSQVVCLPSPSHRRALCARDLPFGGQRRPS